MKNSDLIKEFIDASVIESMENLLSSDDIDLITKYSVTIASQFGSDFNLYTNESVERLIQSFKKNFTLLIQKTWVEESDVMTKESILVHLEKVCTMISEDKWSESFSQFKQVLNSVIALMFGPMCKAPEFEEYSLRIDPEFGIFCWYVKNLPDFNEWSKDKNKAVILIAMYFLSNY